MNKVTLPGEHGVGKTPLFVPPAPVVLVPAFDLIATGNPVPDALDGGGYNADVTYTYKSAGGLYALFQVGAWYIQAIANLLAAGVPDISKPYWSTVGGTLKDTYFPNGPSGSSGTITIS